MQAGLMTLLAMIPSSCIKDEPLKISKFIIKSLKISVLLRGEHSRHILS